MKILAITDEVEELIYGPNLRTRFGHVDLVLSCGDLPYYYLDYVVSTLNVPLYGVHGNHDRRLDFTEASASACGHPWATMDLHCRVVNHEGLLLAGFEGSRRYNNGPYQSTEAQMRLNVARIVPRLLLNKLRYGRYLDILISHAPPRHIHDQPDRCHQGFVVFRWFLRTFRPRYHLHGHIHLYSNRTKTRTQFHDTTVLNVFSYRELEVEVPSPARSAALARPLEGGSAP
jgi:predicted phosphodiesterase